MFQWRIKCLPRTRLQQINEIDSQVSTTPYDIVTSSNGRRSVRRDTLPNVSLLMSGDKSLRHNATRWNAPIILSVVFASGDIVSGIYAAVNRFPPWFYAYIRRCLSMPHLWLYLMAWILQLTFSRTTFCILYCRINYNKNMHYYAVYSR